MSNLELRIEEEAILDLTLGESSDMSFDAVDFVGVPFAPTVEVEDIEGGHRVSITSMGAEGKKTDEFDVMDGEDAATWLSGNVLIGELAESALLTADDAYAAPPKNVEVYGKSTQAGTPTPSSPVPILSVDALTLHASADGTTDYTNWPVQIPLSNHVGRSLPDGTRDTLTLSYIGPSTEHEGWGVFSKVLTQRVGVATINASEWQNKNAVSIGDGWYRTVNDVLREADSVVGATATQGMCTAAPFVYNTTLKSEHVGTQNMYILLIAQESTAAAIAAKYDGATVIYKLKNPITHDLGTVELPVNPAPDLTAWADGGSVHPTLSMTYEQDINIVIGELRSAIADMATS